MSDVLAEVAAEAGLTYQTPPTYARASHRVIEGATYARRIDRELAELSGDAYRQRQAERVRQLRDDLIASIRRRGYQLVGGLTLRETAGRLELVATVERIDGKSITYAELPTGDGLGGYLADCPICGWISESAPTREAAMELGEAHSHLPEPQPSRLAAWWKRLTNDETARPPE